MNQLTKVLLEDLLEAGKKKTTAIYGGGFKPPTKGHFDVVVKATEQNPEIDDFLIYVGGGERNSITQGESIQIWELYKKYLPMKVQVVPVKSPIGDILRYAKEHPEEEVLWVIGARENNPEDFADIASRTRTLNKYPNIELRVIQTSGGISGTATRKAAKDNNKEQFFKMIPDIEEKDQVWDTVTSVVTEIVTDTEVICDNCGWEWSIEDGGDDLYMCHKCGHDNNPDLGEASDPEAGTALPYGSGFTPIKENASYSKDIDVKEKILELTKHMLAKGMNIKPLPKVKFVNGDSNNAREFLGKTAYYDPNNFTITLYTEGRHPKDIVRSFSHEMIHHIQNLENRLGDVSTTNTMEDDNIDKLEQEANLKGTMTFRNWTDSLNESLEEATQYIWKHREDILSLPMMENKKKVINELNEQSPQIYCDMDGVLVDFDKQFEKASGGIPPREYEDKNGKEAFWNVINEKGVGFWVGMPWMVNGKQLWDHIKPYNPKLLSAPSRSNESRLGKRLWVKNNIPGTELILAYAENKKNYADGNNILIDDRPSNIDQWKAAGGIGILFISTEQTIKELSKYGL